MSLDALLDRDLGICHVCGGSVVPAEATRDHVIPICWGGPNEEWNLALAHMVCNARRNAGIKPSVLDKLFREAGLEGLIDADFWMGRRPV